METHRCSRRPAAGLVALAIGVAGVALLLVTARSSSAMLPPEGAARQAMAGPVTLWYPYEPGSAEETALMQVIANALSANPGLVITATQVPAGEIIGQFQVAATAGGGPDLLLAVGDQVRVEADAGLIRNLEADLPGLLVNVYPSAVDSLRVAGDLYGIPMNTVALALYYSKNAIPTPPATTAQLKALVEGGATVASPQGGSWSLYGFFRDFGGQLMDADGRCIANEGGFAPAMHYLKELNDAGATLDIGYGQANQAFLDGDLDMLINGGWALPGYVEAMGSDLGVALLPAGPADVFRHINGVFGLMVNTNTTNFTPTLELALYMTSQASAQIMMDVGGQIPVRSDVISADPRVNTLAQSGALSDPRPTIAQLDNYWEPFNAMTTAVLSGVVSPERGVELACRQMNWLNGFPSFWFYLPLTRGGE